MKYPNRVIKEGETDKTIVVEIQNRLNMLGLGPLQATGAFGPKTKSAIKQFQATHRAKNGNPLEIDGKVGAISWAVLFGINKVPIVTKAGNKLLTEIIKVAKSQVGVMEDPVGSNRGPEINKYLASVDCPPGNFWCAAFIYWCFKEASQNLSVPNPVFKTAGCLMNWNHSKGKRITSAEAAANPSLIIPGQLFILDFGSGKGHTGIIEKVEGGFLHTIEGNSNPSGSSNGIGVFSLQRKIIKINKGFIEYK